MAIFTHSKQVTTTNNPISYRQPIEMVADLTAGSAVGLVQVHTSSDNAGSINDDIDHSLTNPPNEGDENCNGVAANVIMNCRDSSPRGTPSLADDSLANSILTDALSLESSPSILTEASSFKKSISNEAANGIHQQEHPPSTPTHNDGIKEQEHPPSNPTLNEDYADEFEMGRDNTDEFDYSHYKLSPSFSQRDLALSTPDAVPSCDYQ